MKEKTVMHLKICGLRLKSLVTRQYIDLKSTVSPTTWTKVKIMCSGVKDYKTGHSDNDILMSKMFAPWPVWLSGLSASLQDGRSQV